MDNINTIWVSTAPRTGSMWVFNVTREIFRLAKYDVEPKEIPQGSEEMIEMARKVSFPSIEPEKKWVLKVHNVLTSDLPRSKIITIHRDPRDVCASFKEFMNESFERSLNVGMNVIQYINMYKTYEPDYALILSYDHIETRAVETILKIADFVDVKITKADAQKIAVKFSKNNVRNLIEKADKKVKLKKIKNKEIDPDELVYLSSNNYRVFDKNTGFQSGHVSKRKTGGWETFFTEHEKEVMNNKYGAWLKEYGYK